MSPDEFRRSWNPSEVALQAELVEAAGWYGWLVWHDQDSRRNAPGFPDLVLCRPPRLLLVELKSNRGRLRPAQRIWLAALAQCSGVETYVWRPRSWDEALAILAGSSPARGVA